MEKVTVFLYKLLFKRHNIEEKDPCENCSLRDTSCPGGMWCTNY